MNFWNLSDNTQVGDSTEFESMNNEPIPANTNLKSVIEQAEWKSYEGENYINLQWSVIDGQYKGRKVFQKVKVNEPDEKKRDKAIRMLAAIDANCGGKLRASGQMPDDGQLMGALVNRPMVIKVLVWESEDKSMSGNWVVKVSAMNAQNAGPEIDLNEELSF